MTPTLPLAVALLSPTFAEVHPCDGLPPLRWENALFRDAAEPPAGQAPLFERERFEPQTEWSADPADTTGGALVATCFGTSTPSSRDLVLHYYPPAPLAPRWTRPVVLVTGAGDNALRSLSFLAVALSRAGFHSYAMTFAHRHGDNFQQAEQVANVIEHVRGRHPGVLVDLVAYSKGGVATRVYLSNTPEADWTGTHDRYEAQGTRYRGDVGRVIFLGAPHAGLDTAFRWPSSNLFSVGEDPFDTPTSWTAYYPQGVAFPLTRVDLTGRSLYAGGGFPGQGQLLADLSEMHTLPGGNATLGAYAVQQDYFTTWHGGIGFVSESLGIARAIEDAGDVIGRLQRTGVAPDVKLYLGAGGNPIMSVGGLTASLLQTWWGDESAASRRATWEGLVDDALAASFPWWAEAFADDLPRLYAGTAFLGEISGPSDGLLFVASAMDTSGLTLAGAEVVETRLFAGLNHAELVAAGNLAADFYGDPELAGGLFDERLAQKYRRAENQSVEWVIDILRQPVPEQPPEPEEPDFGVGPADVGPGGDGGPETTDAAEGTADGGGTDARAEVDADLREDPQPERDAGGPPAGNTSETGGAGEDAGAPDASEKGGKGEAFGGSCTAALDPRGTPPATGWLPALAGLGLLLRRRRR